MLVDIDERALVAWAIEGDLRAFDELARRYRPGLTVLAGKIAGCRDLAEDAVQDGLLAAFKALPQLGHPERFAAWLGAIVRHRARRLAGRDAGVVPRPLPEIDRLLLHRLNSVRMPEPNPAAVDLAIALEGLPDETAELVLLHYAEGWTSTQLADIFALPLSTVKWRLLDGRRRIRQQLETLQL